MRVVTPVLVLLLLAAGATAQTAFSYQGALTEAGAPAEGTYDFRFQLYAGPTGGSSVATTTATGVAVADGVFATAVDFGATDWRRARWLGVEVRPSGGAYEALGPRTAVLAAPLALSLTALAIDLETAADVPNVIGGYSSNAVVPGLSSATIGGINEADGNTASQSYAAVAGGRSNTASGLYSRVLRGQGNRASGTLSAAAGRSAQALHDQAFVWSGGTGTSSTAVGQFLVDAPGGVGVGTNAPGGAVHVAYAGTASRPQLVLTETATTGDARLRLGNASNAAYWEIRGGGPSNGTLRLGHASGDVMALQSTGSPIDAAAVLATLGTLPIATWAYDAEPGVRHLGPTSQDFAAAFGLGGTDEAIATVDADGVALAALQALLARVEALEARVAAQDAEIERLRAGGE